jgi:hypothetical protein
MLLYTLVFIASVFITLIFFRVPFRQDIQLLISSYKKAGKLVTTTEHDSDAMQELLMGEVKLQFKFLFFLMGKFIILVSPALFLFLCMDFLTMPMQLLLGVVPLIVSVLAFLLVYLIKRYVDRSAQ